MGLIFCKKKEVFPLLGVKAIKLYAYFVLLERVDLGFLNGDSQCQMYLFIRAVV